MYAWFTNDIAIKDYDRPPGIVAGFLPDEDDP